MYMKQGSNEEPDLSRMKKRVDVEETSLQYRRRGCSARQALVFVVVVEYD